MKHARVRFHYTVTLHSDVLTQSIAANKYRGRIGGVIIFIEIPINAILLRFNYVRRNPGLKQRSKIEIKIEVSLVHTTPRKVKIQTHEGRMGETAAVDSRGTLHRK